MGWNRRQQEKQKKFKGERDWSKDDKQKIKDFVRRYDHGNNGRKAG